MTMPRGPKGEKRPADVNARAVMIAKIATGEIEEKLNGAPRDGNEARYAADEPTQIWIATISGRHDLIVRSSGRQEGFAR